MALRQDGEGILLALLEESKLVPMIDPVLVSSDLTGEESGQRSLLYILKLDTVVGTVLSPQLLEDVLMAVIGVEFT